jgi:O-antigen/teichoic acid export membrane protein
LQKYIFVGLRTTKFILPQEATWHGLKILLVILLSSLGVLGIVLSWGVALILALVVGSLFISRIIPGYRPLPTIRRRISSEMFRFSVGSYIAALTHFIPNTVLPLLVVAILGAESNAYFYVSFKVAMALFMLPSLVVLSLLAEGSRDPQGLRLGIVKTTKFIFIILLPGLVSTLLLGDKILLLFGSQYSQKALQTLWILSISAIPFSINEIYVAMRRVQLDIKPTIYVYGATTALSIGFCYFLLQEIGLLGASIGWLLSQTIVAMFTGSAIMKTVGLRLDTPKERVLGQSGEASGRGDLV